MNFVSEGGTLITDARFGMKDDNAHLYPNPLLEEMLGVVYDHGEINEDGFLDVIAGRPKKYHLIEKKIGKGKVVYAHFSLFSLARKGKSKWQSTAILIKRIKSSL